MAGPTFGERALAVIKGRGHGLCNGCYVTRGVQAHHRDPRGMGGSSVKAINSGANGMHLCLRCHNWAESHRDAAMTLGWLVGPGEDPATKPVYAYLPYGRGWYRFTADGVEWAHGVAAPEVDLPSP